MIYYKNGKYVFSTEKIHYRENYEGEVVKYVGIEGQNYWEKFEKLWSDDFKIVRFIEVTPTVEQIERLDIINELELKEGISLVEKYVEYGDLSGVTRSHPLYILVIEKDLNLMSDVVAETLSMMAGGAE